MTLILYQRKIQNRHIIMSLSFWNYFLLFHIINLNKTFLISNKYLAVLFLHTHIKTCNNTELIVTNQIFECHRLFNIGKIYFPYRNYIILTSYNKTIIFFYNSSTYYLRIMFTFIRKQEFRLMILPYTNFTTSITSYNGLAI